MDPDHTSIAGYTMQLLQRTHGIADGQLDPKDPSPNQIPLFSCAHQCFFLQGYTAGFAMQIRTPSIKVAFRRLERDSGRDLQQAWEVEWLEISDTICPKLPPFAGVLQHRTPGAADSR